MARTVNELEYNSKRNEILDTALQLIYTKGYEQMSIQDILDRLKISKGAFYHYFDSKDDLLAALIDRMGKQAEQAFLPILEAADLTAIQKIRRYFEVSAQWKNMQKELIMTLLRMWYTDGNAIVRHKMGTESIQYTRALLQPMIEQGVREKAFTTQYPQEVADIIARITVNLSDAVIGLLLTPAPEQANFEQLNKMVDAYIESIERILGAPAGSFRVLELGAFEDWFFEIQPQAE